MRPTLRLVVGGLCASIVLVVAVVTLAITYSVAIATVRDIGKKHSVALATTARVLTGDYFDVPTQHLDAIADTYSFGDNTMPSLLSEADQFSAAPHEKLFLMKYLLFRSVNFAYSALGTVFEDGSGDVIYLYENTWVRFISRFVWKWPETDMITYLRDVYLSNMTDYRGGNTTKNVWSQFTSYPTIRQIAGDDSRGFWRPVTMTQLGNSVFFHLAAVKPLYNSTGSYLGLTLAARPIAAISDFLRGIRGTANTEAFAVDAEGRLVGSTHATSFFTVKETAWGTPPEPGCVSSTDGAYSITTREYHGCRTLARDFHDYLPLQYAAGRDWFLTSTTAAHLAPVDSDKYFIVSTAVPNSYRLWSLNVILCMPESDVLGDIVEGRNTAIGVTIAVFVAASLLAFGLVYALLRPLSSDTDAKKRKIRRRDGHSGGSGSHHDSNDAESLHRLRRDPTMAADNNTEDVSSQQQPLTEIREVRQQQQLNAAIQDFMRFTPGYSPKEGLSGVRMVPQVCTMLFVDIVGFTGTCARVSAEPLSGLVSQYFDVASGIVMSHDGLIDKFIGDCIMAVWGAPFAVANQEVKAALTGKLLDRACLVPPLSRAWSDVSEELRVRVGISTGEVLAGNMGSEERMNYTVIGDPVNLAARLESMNKQFGTHVMVSEATAAGLGGAFVLRLLMPVAVVGKSKPVNVYEVVGAHASLDAGVRMALDANEHGALYPDAAIEESLEFSDDFANLTMAGSYAADLGRPGDGRAARMRRSQRSTVAMLQEAVAATAADHPLACTAEEAAFAAGFTEAVQAYVRADFAGALQLLDEASAIAGVCPSSTSVPAPPAAAAAPSVELGRAFPAAAVKSVNILLRQIERYGAVDGLPADFDGVYHTEATDLRS